MALSGLARMFDPARGLFVFRLRRVGAEIVSEGYSDRYAAITLVGLSTEHPHSVRSVLHGADPRDVWRALARRTETSSSIGDVALTLWAGVALGIPDRQGLVRRLVELRPVEASHPTVEVAWTLSALTLDQDSPSQTFDSESRGGSSHRSRRPTRFRTSWATAGAGSARTCAALPISCTPCRRCPCSRYGLRTLRPARPPCEEPN